MSRWKVCVLLAVLLASAVTEAGKPGGRAAPGTPPEQQVVLDYVAQTGPFAPPKFVIPHAFAVGRMRINKACSMVALSPDTSAVADFRGRLLARAKTTTDANERARLTWVLARAGSAAVLPLLLEEATKNERGAIDSLALFGTLPLSEGYPLPGGLSQTVVFAPMPDARATEVLLALLLGRPTPDGGDASEERWRRNAVLGALATHTGPAVDAAFANAVANPELRLAAVNAILTSGRAVPVRALAKLLDSDDDDLGRLAARALGQSAQKEAIAALLDCLASCSREPTRQAARHGLADLAGLPDAAAEAETQPDRTAEAAWWRKRFGQSSELFDPAKARQRERRSPGFYDGR